MTTNHKILLSALLTAIGLCLVVVIVGIILSTKSNSAPSVVITESPTTAVPTTTTTPNNAPPQIGFNFIRFYMNDSAPKNTGKVLDKTTPYLQPTNIFADFTKLGAQTYRQFVNADLLWDIVEPQENAWSFTAQDAVIPVGSQTPIVTLFALQYASPTPPWATTFQKTLGPEGQAYLDKIIDRYGASVKYWEVGNEMDHWRIADQTTGTVPDAMAKKFNARAPDVSPADGFSPEEQGKFLAEVADYIRAKDADAVIVLPGMSGLSDYQINTWFTGILKGGGTDAFDIINYHYYGDWKDYAAGRARLQAFIDANGLGNKPVWLTETGSTSEATLTNLTNYPNSEETQAADIFRRLIPAYAHGDALAMWHTYISSPTTPGNTWGGYGVLTDKDVKKPSYWSFKLLADELIPFSKVETISDTNEKNEYKITTANDETKYVVWGQGTFIVPADVSTATSVITPEDPINESGRWIAVTPGSTLTLTKIPQLLK